MIAQGQVQRVAVQVAESVLQLTSCAPMKSTTQVPEQLASQVEVVPSQRTVLAAPETATHSPSALHVPFTTEAEASTTVTDVASAGDVIATIGVAFTAPSDTDPSDGAFVGVDSKATRPHATSRCIATRSG